MSTQLQTRVAICIATYRRPEALRRLLDELRGASLPAGCEVVVVDNDSEGSAKPACDEAGKTLPCRLTYVIETERGIAQARNRAIAAAGNADFVAFIDDDEIPDSNWLDELLRTQSALHADIVSGPVLSRFEQQPPQWILAGRFFERTLYKTGEPVVEGRTGNVLISRAVLDTLQPAFDARFSLTGGEDSHFFMRARQAGFKAVWCERAYVYEIVPPQRTSAAWLLKRAYAGGCSVVACEEATGKTGAARITRMAKGIARVMQGSASAIPAVFMGKCARVRALQKLCLGAGMLAAMAGLTYEPYRRPS